MMKPWIITFSIILGLLACSRETKNQLPAPGFGIVESEIDNTPNPLELPILLNSADPIKGIQFTLTWNPQQVQIDPPRMTEQNPTFTVSSDQGRQGRMKVLVFNMQGGALDLADPVIMTLPLKLLDADADQVNIRFEDPIFAGPSASSYDIPIHHATLRIQS